MPPYTSKLIEILSAKINPLPKTVEGFPSLHPIMRMRRWIDRRVSKRTRVQLPASIVRNGAIANGTVVDMSSTGAGIIGVEGLRIGELVVVTVDALQPLNCEVVWTSGRRAGVKFLRAN